MTVQSPVSATAPASDDRPLLKIEGMIKDFPGLRALDEVSLDLRSGEVVAVVGHNGSGKSTLVKILAGVYTADGGEVELARDGDVQTELHIIHQDLGLIAPLSAIENLGMSPDKGGHALAPFNARRERVRARELISRFGDEFDVDIPVAGLAPAQQSIIAIARALDGWKHNRNVLILDEPTEALHASEVRILFDAVRRVAAEGAGVIFISHRLDEVLDIADRVIVLRDGKKVADERRETLDHDRLVSYVTGIPVGEGETGETRRNHGDTVLEISGMSGAGVESIDITLRAGEVVGVAGVLGSGREALPGMIFGATPADADTFTLGGAPYDRRKPAESIRRGMGFVAGDRARYGSVKLMNARENITLPELRSLRNRFGTLVLGRERAHAQELIEQYDVKPPRAEQKFAQFSGGNQQKIVFAKWLRNNPSVLLLEEPTQGVDIGAKQAIYAAIDAAARQGAGVLVCSSEAKELVRLCDRVLVMRGGAVAAELSGEQLTEARLVLEGHGLTETAHDDHE
jgi:ribose transport system ATP-binding protein